MKNQVNFLTLTTPINILAEKEKFFASSSYNPQFTYDWDLSDIKAYLNWNPGRKKIVEAMLSQDIPVITAEAAQLFEVKLDSVLLNRAKLITASPPVSLPPQSIPQIKRSFEKAFQLLDLKYQVLLSDQAGFNFRPQPSKKTIVISKQADLQFFSIDGEVKHELTHIIRFENGKYNQILPSINSLPTEEGLATYIQDNFGFRGDASSFQHAAEYVASEIAITGSLRQVFDFFSSLGFTPDLAWQRAIRHKFGVKDTNQPGDLMKPAMYYYHAQKIAQISPKDLSKLFVGKIALKEINQIDKYRGVIAEKRLMGFLNQISS